MSSKDYNKFRSNSTGDRLARLSVPKSRKYMQLREEGKSLMEALNIVAPLAKNTQLVLNTNSKENDE